MKINRVLDSNFKREEFMHHKFGVLIGILAITMLMLSGCSGKRGLQGESGTAECIQCHSDNTTIVAINGQWEHSVHATGGNFERNTPPCSGCHTSEGFVAQVGGADPGTPVNPSPVGCFACHEPHTNKNFNLRTTAAVTLEVGNAAIYDRGLSNLCANCHHARAVSPPMTGGDVTITSNRWGPHHGPQADILNGSGLYVFEGATYRNSAHTTHVTDGCPTCHMQAAYGVQAGGHTMGLIYDSHGTETDLVAGCNNDDCHSGLTNFNLDGLQDTVETYITALRSALVADSLLDDASDLPNASTSHPLTMTATEAGALYNYLLLEADRSGGVHNSKYVIDALKASVSALASK
jgi:hypothetical protein